MVLKTLPGFVTVMLEDGFVPSGSFPGVRPSSVPLSVRLDLRRTFRVIRRELHRNDEPRNKLGNALRSRDGITPPPYGLIVARGLGFFFRGVARALPNSGSSASTQPLRQRVRLLVGILKDLLQEFHEIPAGVHVIIVDNHGVKRRVITRISPRPFRIPPGWGLFICGNLSGLT